MDPQHDNPGAPRLALLVAEGASMKSQNFEFLRALEPELATHAGYTEHAAHLVPSHTGTKLSSFAEVNEHRQFTSATSVSQREGFFDQKCVRGRRP